MLWLTQSSCCWNRFDSEAYLKVPYEGRTINLHTFCYLKLKIFSIATKHPNSNIATLICCTLCMTRTTSQGCSSAWSQVPATVKLQGMMGNTWLSYHNTWLKTNRWCLANMRNLAQLNVHVNTTIVTFCFSLQHVIFLNIHGNSWLRFDSYLSRFPLGTNYSEEVVLDICLD